MTSGPPIPRPGTAPAGADRASRSLGQGESERGAENAATTHEITFDYRSTAVRAQFDSAEVARAIESQMLAYGVRIGQKAESGPVVTVGRLDTARAASGWRHINVHGAGNALTPDATMLVTGPPLSLTSVTRPDISLLFSGDRPDLPFIHHLVKYPIRYELEQRGAFLAHSAAVEVVPGACAMFLGRSGSGKSTVFLEMVTEGFGGLGNDSTMIEASPEGVVAAAWPHIVRIGQGTAAHNSVLSALPEDWAPRSGIDGKFEAFFDRLDEVFGRRIVGEPATVRVVFDLTIDTNGTDFHSTRLSDASAGELVERSLVQDRLPTGWLPSWTWKPDFDGIRSVGERLVRESAFYHLEIGVGDPSWPKRLGERLCEIVR